MLISQATFASISGKYDLLKTDYAALASKSVATWQYYMHSPQDGKAIGWYDYDPKASGACVRACVCGLGSLC